METRIRVEISIRDIPFARIDYAMENPVGILPRKALTGPLLRGRCLQGREQSRSRPVQGLLSNLHVHRSIFFRCSLSKLCS